MTQHYVGTKIILAWEQDKDGKPGYGVRYADGYQSWSPKDVFEEAYLPLGHLDSLDPHVQRMVAEYAALREKIRKLDNFMETNRYQGLELVDRVLMRTQCDAMNTYLSALEDRIARARGDL